MKQRRGAKKLGSTTAPAVTAAEFIAALFGFTECEIYFSSLPNERNDPAQPGERRILTRDVAPVEQFIAKWDRAGRGLFFCVSTIEGKRNKANAREITGAHSDIDFKTVAATEAEIWAAIAKLRYPPTVIVRSGYGLHLYWLFKEPLLLEIDDNLERVEAVLRQLADHIGGDLAVCEVARLMRLPGTHNTKGGQWREVTVERIDGPRYELNDLEEWLAESAPVLRRALVSHPSGAQAQSNAVPDNPFLAAARLLGFKPPVDVEARLEAMRYGGAGDSSIHSTQLSVSASLLNAGRDLEEVVGILMDATRAAAGEYGTRWNWIREERALCRMCATWVAKHPPAPKQLPLERENAASLTADHGEAATSAGDGGERAPEPAAVIDLAGARAQRKAKPKKGDTPLHITVAEAALAGMAERGEQLLITDEGGYIYSDGLWKPHTTKTALEPRLDRLLEECTQKLSLNSSSRTINEARKWIIRSPDLYRKAVAWDAHGMVPTTSGLIDPRTGELTAAEPEHHVTWRVPFAYDPLATCPLWLQMLDDAFADRDEATKAQTIQLLQELLGMGLIDRKPKALSRALVLQGNPDTGKSGILNVFAGLFGGQVITAAFDTLDKTHGLMPFAERQPWVLHEAFDPSRWHLSSTTKAIISGDPVQINMKGGAIYSHQFTAPIYWGTNHPAQFKEATHAIVNRLAVVACHRKFDTKKPPIGVEAEAQRLNYASAAHLVLATEMTGVLAWAVDGLRRALVRRMFDLPAESLQTAEQILRDANPVAGFVEDAIEFDPNARISVPDCWAALGLWWIRNKNSDGRHMPSRAVMGKSMKALGDPRIAVDDQQLRVSHTRYYAGIKLNVEGVKLWEQAKASEAYQLKGRLGDASSDTPYDDIPMSWHAKSVIQTMRAAHGEAAVISEVLLSPVMDPLSPDIDLHPEVSSDQTSGEARKNKSPRF